MKNKKKLLGIAAIFLFSAVFFSSCKGTFIVWNMTDIIGLCIFGLIITIAIIMGIAIWVESVWKRWRKKH